MNYDRDPIYLHPTLHNSLVGILAEIDSKLDAEYSVKIISGHRTPEDQFELFKKGRVFKNGKWVKSGQGGVVTNLDGFSKLSYHNYLPCLSLDIGIFKNGVYVEADGPYAKVKFGADKFGLEWGGSWTSFVDRPHIQIPSSKLSLGTLTKESLLQWQRYLKKSGKYIGSLDGVFGKMSQDALEEVTSSRVRSLQTWRTLVETLGPLD
jgi:peptidoglycan LD-endopeptidase CwlK